MFQIGLTREVFFVKEGFLLLEQKGKRAEGALALEQGDMMLRGLRTFHFGIFKTNGKSLLSAREHSF